MKLKITISSEGADATDIPVELALKILRDVATGIQRRIELGRLRDFNGNTIGKWSFSEGAK